MKTSVKKYSTLITTIILTVMLSRVGQAQSFSPAMAEEKAAVQEDSTIVMTNIQEFTKAETGRRAQEVMQQKYVSMWDKYQARIGEGEMMLSVGIANAKFPTLPKDFLKVREMLARQALLNAKGQMIQSIYAEFTGSSQFEIPGSEIEARFRDEAQELEQQRNSLEKEMILLLAEVDANQAAAFKAESASMQELGFVDRTNAFADAVIRRIDGTYSAEAQREAKVAANVRVADASRQRMHEVRASVEALQLKIEQVENQMEAEADKIKMTISNEISLIASMPLIGAVVVDSAETYYDGQYQIAVLMIWSTRLQDGAIAVMKGEGVKMPPRQGRSLRGFAQSIDPSYVFGSRQFVDDKGDRWFVGFGSYPVGNGGLHLTKAQKMARLIAQQNLAYALFADVEAQDKAKQYVSMSQTEATQVNAMDSLSSKISEEVKNQPLSMTQPFLGDQVTHPIMGENIYVVGLAMNATGSRKAARFLKRAYSDKVDLAGFQARGRGAKKGMEQAAQVAVEQARVEEETAMRSAQHSAMRGNAHVSTGVSGGSGGLLDGARIPGRQGGGAAGGYSDDF